MTIGQRITKRRSELNLSVDDLAAKLGKNRATIYRYENNSIKNLPIDIIEPLAKALLTTPAYLVGWDNTPGENEQLLLHQYNELNSDGQMKIMDYLSDLVASGKYVKDDLKRRDE